MTVLSIAVDLWRQAFARKWFLVLGAAVTLFLVGIALTLRLDVIDGALAGLRLFGRPTTVSITAVDVALRPIFKAAAIIIFYPFTLFLIALCAEFAPSLLAPGRIEHMLSLPVRRWELVLGTYLGVDTPLWLGLVPRRDGPAARLPASPAQGLPRPQDKSNRRKVAAMTP